SPHIYMGFQDFLSHGHSVASGLSPQSESMILGLRGPLFLIKKNKKHKYICVLEYAKGMFLLFLYTVLGCGLPIYFRTSISFLPYRTYAAIDYITISTW